MLEHTMEEKNNILTTNDIMNLCFDFYMIGQSNQPFLDAEHLRETVKNSVEKLENNQEK